VTPPMTMPTNTVPEKRKRKRFTDYVQSITLEQLRQKFHKPLHEAAADFGICDTFLKKISRFYGLAKWPYRDVRRVHTTVRKLVSRQDAPLCVKKVATALPSRDVAVDLEKLNGLAQQLAGEVQSGCKPRRERVAIWDRSRRRKLAGAAAPLPENVAKYLHQHPERELYAGQDAAERQSAPSCSSGGSIPWSSTASGASGGAASFSSERAASHSTVVWSHTSQVHAMCTGCRRSHSPLSCSAASDSCSPQLPCGSETSQPSISLASATIGTSLADLCSAPGPGPLLLPAPAATTLDLAWVEGPAPLYAEEDVDTLSELLQAEHDCAVASSDRSAALGLLDELWL